MSRPILILTGITAAIVVAAVVVLVVPGKTEAPTSQTASIPGAIEVSAPIIGAKVSSPLITTGRAKGWYFEASFPVELRDAQNNLLAQGYAQAQSDWMTADWVSFVSVPLTFAPQPTGSQGTLILRKDNPSGEPQFDQSLSIPVTF